jgi:Sec-independent protein translocase protein TatA
MGTHTDFNSSPDYFGPGKLPQLGESIGKALNSFKKAQAGDDEGIEVK